MVLENGSGGGVVKRGVLGGLVRTRRHVVAGRWLIGGDEDIGGLAGSEHKDFGGEWFEVRGVGADHREFVVCDGEEERLIECSIDHT